MLVIREEENEASRGTEGARRATGVARGAAGRTGDGPDPEVAEKATRRRFSGEYKRRIVSEADRCRNVGEVGALLRREGLYSSSLRYLAAARRRRSVGRNRIGEAWTEGTAEGCPGYAHRGIGTRDATAPKKADASGNDHWHPKKVATLLGIPLQSVDDDEHD